MRATPPLRLPAPSDGRWPPRLLAAFGLVFVVLGIAPSYRQDWLLENLLVLAALGWLGWGWRRHRLSDGSYLLIFLFALFHEIGAHYQYSAVPYDRGFHALTGHSLDALLGFQRNQYDRFVHFLYGLLLTPVAAELILRGNTVPGRTWRFLLPVTFMMSHALVYELFEWGAATLFGGDLGTAYLGTQGDPWDAQKDMALATLGSLIVHPAWLWRHRAAKPPSAS